MVVLKSLKSFHCAGYADTEHAGYADTEHAGYADTEHAGYADTEHAGYAEIECANTIHLKAGLMVFPVQANSIPVSIHNVHQFTFRAHNHDDANFIRKKTIEYTILDYKLVNTRIL